MMGILSCILPKNVHEAVALARSAALHAPHIGRAIVVEGYLTGRQREELEDCFHEVIPMREEHFRLGWQAKHVMFSYTPFDRTLFLDADCLVLRDLQTAFDIFAGRDLCFVAKAVPTQETGNSLFAKVSLAGLLDRFQVEWWPQIAGGGHFYFEKTEQARELFERAHRWADLERLRPLGWDRPNVSDELTLQIAVVEAGLARDCTICDLPLVLWTPWVSGDPDALAGFIRCRSQEGMDYEDHEHCVAHFGGDHASWTYRRERWRLAWHAGSRKLPGLFAALLTALNRQDLMGSVSFALQKMQRLPGRIRRLLSSIKATDEPHSTVNS